MTYSKPGNHGSEQYGRRHSAVIQIGRVYKLANRTKASTYDLDD